VENYVASDQPESFGRLVRAFVHDILSQPLSEREDPPQLPSEQAPLVAKNSGHMRQKHAPGTTPNPMGRYEPISNDGGESKLQLRTSSDSANPNRRGKMTAGTMPHPSSRFDFVADEDPEEEVRPQRPLATFSACTPVRINVHPEKRARSRCTTA
jgi:hypothetical protein